MNINNSLQLGVFVRKTRKNLGVTQKDLAMVCGTGVRFIIDFEKGKPTCEIGKIFLVLQALGLSCEMNGFETGGTHD